MCGFFRTRSWLFTLLLLLAASAGASAQEYPARPVKLIVSALPGSSPDLTARILAEQLRKSTGMAFVVENKAGANGIPAVRELSRSAPDGYTLLVGNINSNGLAPALHHKKYGFDVKTAIQPVTLLSDGPSALIASRSQPASYGETLQAWKNNPGKYAYFAAGVGSFGHIWFAKLTDREGLDLLFVPVKGGGEGLQLMYEGSVQYAYVPAASFVGQIRKGDLRALFVTGSHRLPEIPDVPTMREVGLPEDFEINTWVGLFAPANVKPELLKRIHTLFVSAVGKEEVGTQFKRMFMQQQASKSPEEFSKFVESRIDSYRTIAQRSRINVED